MKQAFGERLPLPLGEVGGYSTGAEVNSQSAPLWSVSEARGRINDAA